VWAAAAPCPGFATLGQKVSTDTCNSMRKTKLHYTREYNSFKASWFKDVVDPHFELEPYTGPVPDQHILLGLPYEHNIQRIWHGLEHCSSIIIDNLQECTIPVELEILKPYKDKIFMLTMGMHNHEWLRTHSVVNFMWYAESLWYRDRRYHLYEPDTASDARLFFMPMRRKTRGRELCYQHLLDLLEHDAIYSYVERGISLPGIPEPHTDDQRWFNPDWYNHTLFSVINEDWDDDLPKIYTEKTCKALAFYHPFMLVAQRGVLQMVRDAGFETFPEFFDETYDNLPTLVERVAAVSKQIRTFDRSLARSPAMQAKLQYNHHRFFDRQLVLKRTEAEVIMPVLDFIEKGR